MSADRYLAVSRPLQTKHLRTPRIALGAALIIWLIAVIMAWPWLHLYTVRVYDVKWYHEPMTVCADDWSSLPKGRI